MAIYETREGPLATANVWGALTQCASQGTLNALSVPARHNSIKELWVTFTEDGPTDSAGGIMCLKLSGGGLKYGEQYFVVGGQGREETGSSAGTDGMTPVKFKVNIAVIPGGEIWVFGAQYGTDMGTPELAVTAVYSKEAAPERYYVARMLACGTLDTDTLLTTLVDTALGAITVPPTCHKIYSVMGVQGGITLATATGGTGMVRLRNGIKEGEQSFGIGAQASLSTTTGVSGGYSFAKQTFCDLNLTGGPISPYGCQSGVDWGTPVVGVGLELGP